MPLATPLEVKIPRVVGHPSAGVGARGGPEEVGGGFGVQGGEEVGHGSGEKPGIGFNGDVNASRNWGRLARVKEGGEGGFKHWRRSGEAKVGEKREEVTAGDKTHLAHV